MLPQDVFHSANRKQRYLFLLAVFGLAAVAGVLYVARRPLYESSSTAPIPQGQQILISEIAIGTPDQQQGQIARDNPPIEQTTGFLTTDPIMMRITTAAGVRDAVQVRVRLLAKTGQILELDPPSVEFEPGTNSFCCWQVSQPGAYTLQIFRPEGTITAVPITVQQGAPQPSPINATLGL